MAFGSNYQVDDRYSGSNFKRGEWECRIKSCEEKVSQAGNEMLVIDFEIPNQGILKYYLVDDKSTQEAWERTNQNITRFFDCFKIQRGNFNINSWVGAGGIILIDKGAPNAEGKQYFEVKRLIVQKSQNLQQSPQQQNGYENNYGQQNKGYPAQGQSQGTVQQYGRQDTGNGYQRNNSYNQPPVENNELDNIPF